MWKFQDSNTRIFFNILHNFVQELNIFQILNIRWYEKIKTRYAKIRVRLFNFEKLKILEILILKKCLKLFNRLSIDYTWKNNKSINDFVITTVRSRVHIERYIPGERAISQPTQWKTRFNGSKSFNRGIYDSVRARRGGCRNEFNEIALAIFFSRTHNGGLIYGLEIRSTCVQNQNFMMLRHSIRSKACFYRALSHGCFDSNTL